MGGGGCSQWQIWGNIKTGHLTSMQSNSGVLLIFCSSLNPHLCLTFFPVLACFPFLQILPESSSSRFLFSISSFEDLDKDTQHFTTNDDLSHRFFYMLFIRNSFYSLFPIEFISRMDAIFCKLFSHIYLYDHVIFLLYLVNVVTFVE